ncbi:MAG: hypothetical protein QOD74_2507 [Variibacter sp.]|jgi:CelD/BcsL family acetyltransferase involved in cellulose biosynthesis|nr:hypothetical protein [Variibacter sp.]
MTDLAALLDRTDAVHVAPARSSFALATAELVDFDQVPHDEWDRLARAAAEPNVFYTRAFAEPAKLAFGNDVVAIAVRTPSGELVGLAPVRSRRQSYGLPLRMLLGWTHPFAPLSQPLIAEGNAELVAAALLDFLADSRSGAKLAFWPMLLVDGAFARALVAQTRARGGQSRILHRHARAALVCDASQPVADAVTSKKRKELRRQMRRLAETGEVSFTTARTPAEVAAALDDFLRLEASGWKGRAGTAAERSPDLRQFVTSAVNALAASDQAQVDTLRLNGTAIAAAITLRSGDHAWFWKIAYDETHAAASPGVQLTVAITDQFRAEATTRSVDSCASADHPMINHLWRDRIELADVLIASPGVPSFVVDALCAALRLRSGMASAAKSLRAKLGR